MVTTWYMTKLMPSEISLKQDLTLEFCRNKNKAISILTETCIKRGQIHHIRNNWLGPIFFSPRDSHTKGMQDKNEGNKKRIILGNLNCTLDKLDRVGENKTQRLWRCCSNDALSKLIMENGFEDLKRRNNPDSSGSPATIGPLARIQDRQGLYWYKNCQQYQD